MIIHPLLYHIRWIVIVLVLSSVATARAESRLWSPQVVDGYTVTLSMTGEPAPPGDNNVVIMIRDPEGRPVDGAVVSAALLAYTPVVSTSANAPGSTGQHIHSPGAGRATEPQGLVPVPMPLVAGAEAGFYRGIISFAKEGTWTVVVAFTIHEQSRAALFKVGIVDQRPRLALLAGFAAVNGAIVVVAALCKRTGSSQRRLRAVSPLERADSARPLIIAFVVVIAIVAVAVIVSVTRGASQRTQQATAPHFVDVTQQDHHSATSGRSLVVARLGETGPGISGETGPLMTTLVRGQYPEGATQATVRTDENCTPDNDGVSHCLNELDLGGTTIVVQHHHKMSLTPCLTPGETVKLMTVAEYQARS